MSIAMKVPIVFTMSTLNEWEQEGHVFKSSHKHLRLISKYCLCHSSSVTLATESTNVLPLQSSIGSYREALIKFRFKELFWQVVGILHWCWSCVRNIPWGNSHNTLHWFILLGNFICNVFSVCNVHIGYISSLQTLATNNHASEAIQKKHANQMFIYYPQNLNN